jgi:hypothetical protein
MMNCLDILQQLLYFRSAKRGASFTSGVSCANLVHEATNTANSFYRRSDETSKYRLPGLSGASALRRPAMSGLTHRI